MWNFVQDQESSFKKSFSCREGAIQNGMTYVVQNSQFKVLSELF